MAVKLPFMMTEFLRIAWTSQEAQDVWKPRVEAVSSAWTKTEREAVELKVKPLALQSVDPKYLGECVTWAAQRGLKCAVLDKEGAHSIYGNATLPYDPEKPWTYRVVIGKEEDTERFRNLWNDRDDDAIGAALGFPTCCRKFFTQRWVKEGWRDLTFPMVMDSSVRGHYHVNGPISCNILLRWLFVRMVSHLPCSFDCRATDQIGRGMMTVMMANHPEESHWLAEMLNWPIRWNSLHGVAIITTPVLKIVTSSDPLSHSVIIDRDGPVYPAEGVRGTEFPFKQFTPVLLNRVNTWSDNGFNSRSAMEKAHAIVLSSVTPLLGEKVDKIIDLGCGNGLLLEKMSNIFPGSCITGVEVDPIRYDRATKRLAHAGAEMHQTNLFSFEYWKPTYDLTIISLNRFMEVSPIVRQSALDRISRESRYLLIYSYDGKNISHLPHYGQFVRINSIEQDNAAVYLLRSCNAKSA